MYQLLPCGSRLKRLDLLRCLRHGHLVRTRNDGAQMACVVMCGRQHTASGSHVRSVLVNGVRLESVW